MTFQEKIMNEYEQKGFKFFCLKKNKGVVYYKL